MADKSAAVTVNAKFKNVILGDETARLGMEIDCKKMAVMKAVSLFRGSRCLVKIALGDMDDKHPPGFEMPDAIQSTVDFKSISIKTKVYTAGLTFNLAEVPPERIAQFAKQSGHITIERMSAIPEKPKKTKPAPPGTTDDEGSTD